MLPTLISQLAATVASVLGISFIIVFHEFGHYTFCKIFNVYTPTFSIGIGKILFSKKIGDTNFCISAGPIGGYVEVASEQGINGSLGFNQIPYYQKVLIMLGGIFCNFLLAYLFLVGLFFKGLPENIAGSYEPCIAKISAVTPESINHTILQPNDILLELNHQSIHDDVSTARMIISQHYSTQKTIHAQIQRAHEILDINLNLKGAATPPSIARQLEVSFELKPGLSLKNACIQAYIAVVFYTQSIIVSLKNVIKTKSSQGFVGPLMAVAASSKSAQKGFAYLIFFLAIISINLGFMNLLPLPIFDGGQFTIFTIETLIGRQFSEATRTIIGTSSWILALGLLVLFTIRDLTTLIFG